ncbi:MAG: DUF4129 domain-containing protein [Dehalococcoidia bacterium]|nr:DUF4129 domain-containing protein [Dehalococcoidia bacterium]
MTLRMRHIAFALFVLMEGFGWYVALRAMASSVTRDAFRLLKAEIGLPVGGVGEAARVEHALAIVRDAAQHATAGPSLVVVLLGAGGAVLLVRGIARLQLPLPLAAAVGVSASLLAFHVLLHIALTGDLLVWESSGLVGLLGGGGGPFADQVTAASFIDNPDPSRVAREPLAVMVGGLTLLWLRFLIAGRGALSYEGVLRSFGIGFGLLLMVSFVTEVSAGVHVLWLVIGYFVLGALALAVAHAARSSAAEGTVGRSAPWLLSVGVTLAAVAGLAVLFGMLALLDVQRAFQPIVGAVLGLLGRLLMLVILPLAFVLQWILERILEGRTLPLDEMARNLQALAPTAEQSGGVLPGWLLTGVRAVLMLAAVWLLYRIGRLLFTRIRRRAPPELYEEARLAVEASAPRGGLFGGRFGGRGGASTTSTAWLRRHAIYALFARVVTTTGTRGLLRRPGETPVEFARHARARFDAPPFEPIARAFDSARYGRHYPDGDAMRNLDRAFGEWERTHPIRAEAPRDEARPAPGASE